jgi:hypothetical protein
MKPTIICLTPVKNEAWILDRFLQATSLWADFIIIADQMSTDSSQEIAKKYSKVILIENKSEIFNEPERQKLLINEARKIEGPRLLITLDADEMFTPDIMTSPEWETILNSQPGTIFRFQWANLRPDMKNMWMSSFLPLGYMDDEYIHSETTKIHSTRIPLPANHQEIILNQIKVIHFQYTDWERMQSKHRWYQCFERINFQWKSNLDIFRMYHHMYAIPSNDIVSIPKEWIDEYKKLNIDILNVNFETKLWWDDKVLEFFEIYGTDRFRKLYIWDVSWEKKSKIWGKENIKLYKDPRTLIDRIVQFWLLKSQPHYPSRNIRRVDRIIKRLLKY